jgi:hypothetical protein
MQETDKDARIRTYLLLSVIESLPIEIRQSLTYLQDLPDVRAGSWDIGNLTVWPLSNLEYLLLIGIYSDRKSMAAALAFHLVQLIAFG